MTVTSYTPEVERQLALPFHRQVARHLAEHPGFASFDRLCSELLGDPRGGIDGMRQDATRGMVLSALRRLQAIGFVDYDAEYGGWVHPARGVR